jgi:hypothetical protein
MPGVQYASRRLDLGEVVVGKPFAISSVHSGPALRFVLLGFSCGLPRPVATPRTLEHHPPRDGRR